MALRSAGAKARFNLIAAEWSQLSGDNQENHRANVVPEHASKSSEKGTINERVKEMSKGIRRKKIEIYVGMLHEKITLPLI